MLQVLLHNQDLAQPPAALGHSAPELCEPLSWRKMREDAAVLAHGALNCITKCLPLQLPLAAHPAACLEITSHSSNLMQEPIVVNVTFSPQCGSHTAGIQLLVGVICE